MSSTHLFSLVFHPRRQLQPDRFLVAWLQRSVTDGEYKPGGGTGKLLLTPATFINQSCVRHLLQHSTGGAWGPEGAAGVAEGQGCVSFGSSVGNSWLEAFVKFWPAGALLVYADVCAGCRRNWPCRWLILALVFVRLWHQLAAKIDPAENFFFFKLDELSALLASGSSLTCGRMNVRASGEEASGKHD